MNQSKSNEEVYRQVRGLHTSLDRRLQMLLKKSYLTADEELEIRILKKRKLYCKDVMESIRSYDEEEK